jgi:hypothetical protein
MSATKMTTTMTRPIKNMASALLDDPWELAAGRLLIPGARFPSYTGSK